jgi:hypothetical protein
MRLRYAIYLVAGMIGPVLVLGQQPPLTVIPTDHPMAGRAVVIAVKSPASPNPKISWTKKGDGEFITETLDKDLVKFVAHEPGSTVIIMCDISSSDGTQNHYKTTLTVAEAEVNRIDIRPIPILPSLPTPHPTPPQPIPHAEGLRLVDIPYMVSSGWMGDAIPENGSVAALNEGNNQGCMPGSIACIKVDYTPANGKKGWAAFAWQRVIDNSGDGANWGQSPGADLSSGGYKSVRVNAKGLPNGSGAYPQVQFKSGGNVDPKYTNNPASYAVAGPVEQLNEQFQEFCLSLERQNLSNVVSAFTVVVARKGNTPSASFLLDNIRFSTQPCSSQSRATPAAAPTPVPDRAGDLRLVDVPYMVSSGWMGDAIPENGNAAALNEGNNQGCMPGSISCIKVDYTPENGKKGWAAFAWQRVIDDSGNGANWGQRPGANLSSGGFRSLRIYAKGLPNNSGAFPIVQFKSGGNVDPQYRDNLASYAVAGPFAQLSGQFQEFCLSLEHKNLSNVVSPFTIVVTRPGNTPTASFLLDNIRFSTQPCH